MFPTRRRLSTPIRTPRKARRLGSRIESLEGRRMMFGDFDAVIEAGLDLDPTRDPVAVDAIDIDLIDRCIDFEDLAPLAIYGVGTTFVADNTGLQAKITGEPFTWSGGGVTAAGETHVDHFNHAGHAGQEMAVNNILLDFDFGGPVSGVRLLFGEYGGNLNLEVNGDFRNFEDFQDVNGLVVGGTTVTVPVGGFGDDVGVINISGTVHSLKLGGQELWIDHVCVADRDRVRMDWGDAPDDPYPTLAASNGARHEVDPNVFLGRTVDAEPNGQPTSASDGDDTHPAVAADDEDGVEFLTPLVPGSPAKVRVVASTDGWLNTWVDFDRDGSWSSSAAENIFSGQALNAGVNDLTFMVPAWAKPGPNDPTYSRWRFSTTDRQLRPMQTGNNVPNGEVEDHLVFIRGDDQDRRMDFGDAPDLPYGTIEAHNGARHAIDPKVHLGRWVDAERDGQPSYLADGDDNHWVDDEDGVFFVTPIVPGQDAKVEVLASVDGHLDAWIDLDQNGDWTPDEKIADSQFMVQGSNIVDFVVPDDALPVPTRPTYARFRFSLAGGLGPDGPARNGEVEDYMILNGDLNHDGRITPRDVDLLCRAIHAGAHQGDLNGDGNVDNEDMDYLIEDILDTSYGDANLDGLFNSTDLVKILAAGEYEDGIPHNSGWAEGDFNCDGEFDSSDLVKAMSGGGYTTAAIPAALSGSTVAPRPDRFEDPALLEMLGALSTEDVQRTKTMPLLAAATDSIFDSDDV